MSSPLPLLQVVSLQHPLCPFDWDNFYPNIEGAGQFLAPTCVAWFVTLLLLKHLGDLSSINWCVEFTFPPKLKSFATNFITSCDPIELLFSVVSKDCLLAATIELPRNRSIYKFYSSWNSLIFRRIVFLSSTSIEKKNFMTSKMRFWILPKIGIRRKIDRTIEAMTANDVPVIYVSLA